MNLLRKFEHKFKRLFASRSSDRKATATPYIAQPEKSVSVPLGPEDYQPKLVHGNAPLESVPAEIRRHLLFILDFEGLKALIFASPVYLQQYILDREHLLSDCCERTLGNNIIMDACAVFQSGLISFSKILTHNSLTQFFQSYKDRRASSQHPSLKKMFTANELMAIMTFHTSVIMPIMQQYIDWALGNLAKETKKDLQSYDGPLSGTEHVRAVRALYHFQLYCNLFGVGHDSWEPSRWDRWDDDEDRY